MFHWLGRQVSRFWPLVIMIWVSVAVVLHLKAPRWDDVAQDGDMAYLPARMTSVRGGAHVEAYFPGPSPDVTLADLKDWPKLCRDLVADAQATAGRPAQRLFTLLKPDTVADIRQWAAGKEPGEDANGRFLADLNRVLKRDDFYTPESFADVKLSPDLAQAMKARKALSKEADGEIRRLNRQLLDTAYPDAIQRGPLGNPKSQVVVLVERPDEPLTEADLAVADELSAYFKSDEALAAFPIVNVWDRETNLVKEKLVSADGQAVLVVVGLSTEFMAVKNKEVVEKVGDLLAKTREKADFPPGLALGMSGSAAIGGDMIAASARSIKNTETTTVVLVLVILLFVYRAPMMVVIPLTTIVTSVFVATRLVALLVGSRIPLVPLVSGNPLSITMIPLEVFSTSKVFIIVILFGAGTDFCLFLISRYREEQAAGIDRVRAVVDALGNVGSALAASAFTTICGLGVMLFADFGKYRQSGPTISLCLFVALVACLTLAPALLRMCGKWVDWNPLDKWLAARASRRAAKAVANNTPLKVADPNDGFWEASSRWIMAWPGTILTVSMLIIMALAWPGRNVEVTYDMLSELPANSPSVAGTTMLRRHFAPGDTGPVTIVVKTKNGDLNSPEGKDAIAKLSKELMKLNTVEEDEEGTPYVTAGVEDVRSLAYPLGGVPLPGGKSGLLGGTRRLVAKDTPEARERYLTTVTEEAGKITRFEVILAHDPFSKDAQRWLEKIDTRLEAEKTDPQSRWWYGAEFDLVGVTAGLRDLESVTQSDLALIKKLVFLAVLGVLLVLLRKIVVCLYLMATVVLSYYVTMAVTQELFAWLHPDFQGLDWKVPLFLFVILVAVGMDYNIYLISRVVEEQKRRGLLEGIRVAVVQTGGIITSCGVIMAGTFVSMMTGTLRGMTELGFALSFGVLLDTLYVRTILVPAYLVVVDRFREKLRLQREAREQARKDASESKAEVEAPVAIVPEETPADVVRTPHSGIRMERRSR